MLRPFSVLAVPFLAAALALIAACSSKTVTDSGSSGSSGSADASGDGEDDDAADAADAAPAPVNGCKVFADRSAAGDARTLTWDFSIATSKTDRCIIIKKGQIVTWNGDFDAHSLDASGGDTPNPIHDGANGTVKITFPNTGTFGFISQELPAMTGAVQVTE